MFKINKKQAQLGVSTCHFLFKNELRDVIQLIAANSKEIMIAHRRSLPIDSKIGNFKKFSNNTKAINGLDKILLVVEIKDYANLAKEVLGNIEDKEKLNKFYNRSVEILLPKLTGLIFKNPAVSLFVTNVIIYTKISQQLGIDKAFVESPVGEKFTDWLSVKLYKNK